jgi:MOSC domain-containing protein YiiM
MNADLFMSRAVYHITADHYHLLFEVPQMNADLFMSRAVYHVAAEHYSVWLLQNTSSQKSPR